MARFSVAAMRAARETAVDPDDPLPASVVTFHMHGGSALSPVALQLPGVPHGTAGAGLPPGQKCPTGHSAAAALVAPAAQP